MRIRGPVEEVRFVVLEAMQAEVERVLQQQIS